VLKKILTIALSAIAMQAGATTIGAHLGSWHDRPGFNNTNPGLYVKLDNGVTAGYYRNSIRGNSAYLGHTSSVDLVGTVRAEATIGLITGYTVSKVMPFVIPSVSVEVFPTVRARLIFIPMVVKEIGANVFSLSIEKEF